MLNRRDIRQINGAARQATRKEEREMNNILLGRFMDSPCRLQVECYPKTAEIKLTLVSSTGPDTVLLTQNLGQDLPPYQAFLSEGILDVNNTSFMDFADANRLGFISAYKRYNIDLFSGRPRKMAALFQFDKVVLMAQDPAGCSHYEQHYASLLDRHAKRAHILAPQRKAGAATVEVGGRYHG